MIANGVGDLRLMYLNILISNLIVSIKKKQSPRSKKNIMYNNVKIQIKLSARTNDKCVKTTTKVTSKLAGFMSKQLQLYTL